MDVVICIEVWVDLHSWIIIAPRRYIRIVDCILWNKVGVTSNVLVSKRLLALTYVERTLLRKLIASKIVVDTPQQAVLLIAITRYTTFVFWLVSVVNMAVIIKPINMRFIHYTVVSLVLFLEVNVLLFQTLRCVKLRTLISFMLHGSESVWCLDFVLFLSKWTLSLFKIS